ncbi:MAG: glycosyltransferase family 39 protein [Elusimicrobiota bacterium]
MTERRRAAALAAACSGATALVFLPSIRFPFLNWDDGVNVIGNANLNFGGAGAWWMLTGSSLGHWHPLTWLTLAADRAVWGGSPSGFHLTNVLLHALNAGLFFLLARRLLLSVDVRQERADAGAAFAALFWALHPLRVESVAWISERRDVLSAAFILASALAYLRGADEGDGDAGRRWRRRALAFGAAAMASKVFAIVLPAVFLVLDAGRRGRPRWKEKLPWLAPVAVALYFNLAAQAESEAAVSWSVFGLKARLAQASYGLAFYAWKTVWPANLGPLYERSLLLEPAPFVLSAVAVAAAAALAWSQRKRFPRPARMALVYVLLALPALGLFKSGRMTAADRYSYLPALPLSLLAGAALVSVSSRRIAMAAALGAIGALGFLTSRQLPVWSSDVSLWARACQVSPLSYFARLKLASAEENAGLDALGAADRQEASRLHAEVFDRAADIYAARGDGAAASAARESSARGIQLIVP